MRNRLTPGAWGSCAASLVMLVSFVGCGEAEETSVPSKPPVVIFAAASATDVVEELKLDFLHRTGTPLEASYAASSTLAQQIEQGANAAVFLSANTKWADYLQERGVVAQSVPLLGNKLVVIVPATSLLQIDGLDALADESVEHLALGDPDSVPAGMYARQALEKAGLWDRLEEKVVAAADVRQALAWVETGAAETGIVYATDAAASKQVRTAYEIPTDLTEPVIYPLVLTKSGDSEPAAKALFEYLQSADAAAIFERHGFAVVARPRSE